MSTFTAILLFGLLPLLAGGLYWGGKLIRAISGRRAAGPVGMMVLLGLALLAFATLNIGGRAVESRILGKTEAIERANLEIFPTVIHHLRVTLEAGGSGAYPRTYVLDTDPSGFDRLREGQNVPLRLHTLGPLQFASFVGGGLGGGFPWLEMVRLGSLAAKAASLLAILALVWWPWAKARGRIIILGMLGVALLLDSAALRSWWWPRPSHAVGEVVEVQTVSKAYVIDLINQGQTESYDLPQPYDEAQVRFSPTTGGPPVVAVDRVDSGTAGALQPSQQVGVEYSLAAPREARLDGGRRSYALRAYGAYALAIGIVLILYLMLSTWAPAMWEHVKTAAERNRARRKAALVKSSEDRPNG